MQTQGFRGSLRIVPEWATRRRRVEKLDAETLRGVPSARTIARMLTIRRDDLSKPETVTVVAVETSVPSLIEVREIIEGFHAVIRRKAEADHTARTRQPCRFVRQWHRQRYRSRPRGDRVALVQWPNRRTNHQT